MNLWPLFESVMYRGLRALTLSRVDVVDEGGVEALLSGRPVLIAANHQSHADTPVLFGALPGNCRKRTRVVSGNARFSSEGGEEPLFRRIERWFLHGLACHAYRAILVSGGTAGPRSIERLVAALAEGDCVAIYPEGTRSRTGALGPLKPGVAMVAAAARCPVVPVRIDGMLDALPKSALRVRFRSHAVVRFRTPLALGPDETPEEFLERLARALSHGPAPAEPRKVTA
jgi:1-acyl-sn-glycerol-3-phosphate acyltransferase